MKVIGKIALGVCALALFGGVFFSCANAADGSSSNQTSVTGGQTQTQTQTGTEQTQTQTGTEQTQTQTQTGTEQTQTQTGSDQTQTQTQTGTEQTQTQTGTEQTQTTAATGTEQTQTQTPDYTEVWTGPKTMAWSGDDNCVVIDHAKFTADFNSLRITYNASAGAIKLAACDPWTEIKDATMSAGSVGDDGALNLPTGDAQTVTVKLSDAAVALIKGQNKDGAWGGLKIFGADTVTIIKVESFKDASASTTQQPQTTNGGEQQTQSGGEQAQTPAYTEVWSGTQTIDWGAPGQLQIDHALFTADFNALRLTYNASAGAIKLAASDPWTSITLTAASISAGSIGADGAFNLPTGDAQTVTIKLSASDVALIKGQNTNGAWGGLTIQGADTITLTKVESVKQN